jgi:hypothetical protein
VHDEWDSFIYRAKKMSSLISDMRAIPDRLGENPLSPVRASELKGALVPLLTFDVADLVCATRQAIAVLDTIINDEALTEKGQ